MIKYKRRLIIVQKLTLESTNLLHTFFSFCNTEVKEACLPYYAFVLIGIQAL
jgi:hypothetical protein